MTVLNVPEDSPEVKVFDECRTGNRFCAVRRAECGHQLPFTSAIRRTLKRQLHSDSGPLPANHPRRVVIVPVLVPASGRAEANQRGCYG
jgi:hypothetical protein